MALMSELTTENNSQVRPFKPKIYQRKRRAQHTFNYYERGKHQNKNRCNSRDKFRRSPYREKPQFEKKILRKGNLKDKMRGNV